MTRRGAIAALIALALPGAVPAQRSPPVMPGFRTLPPEALGAVRRPIWPGSSEQRAFIGDGEVQAAHAVTGIGARDVRTATIDWGLSVQLSLVDGRCLELAPPAVRQIGCVGVARKSDGRWTIGSGKPGEIVFNGRSDGPRSAATLPMSIIAIDALPDPHGETTRLTALGEEKGELRIVTLIFPMRRMFEGDPAVR